MSTITQDDLATLEKLAQQTWVLMESACREGGGFPYTHKRFGEGYCLIATVAQHIRQASRQIKGADCNDEMVELTRRYLRASGNVVVMGPADNDPKKHRWMIFVARSWTKAKPVPLPLGTPSKVHERLDYVESRLTPHEAGEDRKPEPVVVNHKPEKKKKKSTPPRLLQHLSTQQYAALLALESIGGEISNAQGRCTALLSEFSNVPFAVATLASLDERGLVERRIAGKRTMQLKLLDAGRDILAAPAGSVEGRALIFDYLGRVRTVHDARGRVTAKIANALGIQVDRVTHALLQLEQEGLLRRHRKPRRTVRVDWLGPDGLLRQRSQPAPAEPPPAPKPTPPAAPAALVADDDGRLVSLFGDVSAALTAAQNAVAETPAGQRMASSRVDDTARTQVECVRELIDEVEQGKVNLIEAFSALKSIVAEEVTS